MVEFTDKWLIAFFTDRPVKACQIPITNIKNRECLDEAHWREHACLWPCLWLYAITEV